MRPIQVCLRPRRFDSFVSIASQHDFERPRRLPVQCVAFTRRAKAGTSHRLILHPRILFPFCTIPDPCLHPARLNVARYRYKITITPRNSMQLSSHMSTPDWSASFTAALLVVQATTGTGPTSTNYPLPISEILRMPGIKCPQRLHHSQIHVSPCEVCGLWIACTRISR